MLVEHHHLSYCSNIHPGEKWQDHFSELKRHIPEIKKNVAAAKPFGIGLRLSAEAASTLLQPEILQEFKAWLEQVNCYVFTINGFPYGQFHLTEVKGQVHEPDWTSSERLEYTQNLALILAELLPNGLFGTISTSPVSYKGWFRHSALAQLAILEEGAQQLAEMALFLQKLEDQTGKYIHLALEPEPDGLLEDIRSTIDFFENHLWAEEVLKTLGMSESEAKKLLQRYIGICLDTCHFAVMFENPVDALQKFEQAGIQVLKFQISAALCSIIDVQNIDNQIEKLQELNEPVYLHQVCARMKNESRELFSDIPAFFEQVNIFNVEELRTHFHVPLFTSSFEHFTSTQVQAEAMLNALAHRTNERHIEVETYTWSILPSALKLGLVNSIVSELDWALEKLRVE
jgi:hypothetical protein